VELKPGYKQASVGPIPDDWEEVLIGELLTFKNGLNKTRRYFGRGTPIVNYMDVFERPALTMSSLAGRVEVDKRELRAYEVRKGDVFFTRTSETIEEIGIAAVMLDEAVDTVYSGFVLRGRPTDRRLDDTFKAYCFTPRYVRKQITSRASYTTRALTNGRALSATALALPPLYEQHRIAAALRDVDALLHGLTRLIAKKRDLKQAAMQQLLTGRTRLPGFAGPWDLRRMREVGEIRSGGTPSTSNLRFWNGDVPWCTPTDITTNGERKYLTGTARTISAAGLQSSSAELIPARSLIMTSRATVGECAINLVPVATNQGFKNIVPFDAVDVEFLYYLVATQKAGLLALCGGSTFLEISKRQVAEYEITLPIDRDEQAAIATILSDMDAELAALEARRAKTQALKQAMMQSLLTGRIRFVTHEPAHA
jgi:type I restriction enzyme S subunit